MKITDEMVEAACKAHAPQFEQMDPEIRKYARDAMRAALTAAIAAAVQEGAKPVAWLVKIFGNDGLLLDTRLEFTKPGVGSTAETEFVPLYAHPRIDGLVETWRPMYSAPKDGTAIDLWGVNHLHPAKTGRRAVNVTWGPVLDWMGNEREDWQHGQGEDFEPTHWMPILAGPALRTKGGE